MSNVPPEPDEFQTRMRQPDPSADVESTNQSSPTPAAQPPAAQPPAAQPPAAQPPQSPFAPPGFGGASQPGTPPHQAPGYGQQPGAYSQPPTQPYGQPVQQQGQGQPGQPAPAQQGFGQHSQPQQQPGAYQQPSAAQPGAGWNFPPQPPRDASPLKAAFDLSFNKYATPGIVKIVYIVGIVLVTLGWIFGVIGAFLSGAPRSYGSLQTEGTIVPGILMLIFGWIPGAFFILLLRVTLELTLSNVRTAMDVRVLRQRSDEDAD